MRGPLDLLGGRCPDVTRHCWRSTGGALPLPLLKANLRPITPTPSRDAAALASRVNLARLPMV